jgi:hypothetical protein
MVDVVLLEGWLVKSFLGRQSRKQMSCEHFVNTSSNKKGIKIGRTVRRDYEIILQDEFSYFAVIRGRRRRLFLSRTVLSTSDFSTRYYMYNIMSFSHSDRYYYIITSPLFSINLLSRSQYCIAAPILYCPSNMTNLSREIKPNGVFIFSDTKD